MPLSVILDKSPAEIAKPSAITESSRESQGAAKTGVRENNLFPEQNLAAAQSPLVEQPKVVVPKDAIGKRVLTVKKSPQEAMVEILPELLATKNPVPDIPEEKEKTYAPAPSVAKPAVAAPPPAEQIVSSEPVFGEKHEKIVFAKSVQENPPAEKPGNLSEEPKLVKIEEPKPVSIEQQKSVDIAKVKQVEIEKPKPLEIEKKKLVNMDEPRPVTVTGPTPVKIVEARPAKTEDPQPAKNDVTSEAAARPVETDKPDVLSALSPAIKIPSLAELSIASARKFASDDGRKIKFGDRRKTIGMKEQDFRYAMYVESVRLKLQRVGMFNYPAAAAKANLSGTLIVVITIRADGSLEEFSVMQPSEYAVFNKGAENIVKMSSPFSPLPENIRQDTDILNIKINWSFSNSSQSFD